VVGCQPAHNTDRTPLLSAWFSALLVVSASAQAVFLYGMKGSIYKHTMVNDAAMLGLLVLRRVMAGRELSGCEGFADDVQYYCPPRLGFLHAAVAVCC
jgi:hypothetical protein